MANIIPDDEATFWSIRIPAGPVELEGDLVIPPAPSGVVVFAHGSGSSRHSPRNRYVAGVLQRAGVCTLLMDLLTPDEEILDAQTAHLRFDADLLAGRLGQAIRWLGEDHRTMSFPIGLFGASTGAGAALMGAAKHPQQVAAVVCRGGRVDLAGDALDAVRCPTLLIVGGRDELIIDLNKSAMRKMTCPMQLKVIPGASHLFEERGGLEEVSRLASDWFIHHLGQARVPAMAGR